jgi:NTE family protein
MNGLHHLRSQRIGLALSGGSVRGLAHIGILKILSEEGISPSVIAGTSVGSLIGAALAAGMQWQEIAFMARNTFWPKLLHGETLERFCRQYLPRTFVELKLPFAAITTEFPAKCALVISDGDLPSAISASCAMRGIRRPVKRAGKQLKDGGITCVLPSEACRTLGAKFIIGSDVWELSSLLRGAGMEAHHPWAAFTYPLHYHAALRCTSLLIQPQIPLSGYVPGSQALERMMAAGEDAARRALAQFSTQSVA